MRLEIQKTGGPTSRGLSRSPLSSLPVRSNFKRPLGVSAASALAQSVHPTDVPLFKKELSFAYRQTPQRRTGMFLQKSGLPSAAWPIVPIPEIMILRDLKRKIAITRESEGAEVIC